MKILRNIANEQENLTSIILTTIFLSIGLEFIINSLLILLGVEKKHYFYLSLGIFIVVIVLIFSYVSAIRKIKKSVKLEGFILVHGKDIVSIPGHGFSEDMHKNLRAAFIENNAFKKTWAENTFYDILEFDENNKMISFKLNDAYKLFIEAFQYTILESLSTHLTDYFNQDKIKSEKVDTKYRNDISELVLSNRFLNLFSEDMKNRELFSESNSHDTVYASGKNGALYSKFDLTLPKNSKIVLVDYKTIELHLPKMIVKIIFIFDGMNTIIPANFVEYYLGLDSQKLLYSGRESGPFKVSLEFQIEIKKSGMFTYLSNDYYIWIDDFISKTDKYFSTATFFKDINWSSTETLLRVKDNFNNSNL